MAIPHKEAIQAMTKIIELLERALREARRVEVLGVCDRVHINKAIGCVKEALEELTAQGRSDTRDREVV
jgi:hypothetical protein